MINREQLIDLDIPLANAIEPILRPFFDDDDELENTCNYFAQLILDTLTNS